MRSTLCLAVARRALLQVREEQPYASCTCSFVLALLAALFRRTHQVRDNVICWENDPLAETRAPPHGHQQEHRRPPGFLWDGGRYWHPGPNRGPALPVVAHAELLACLHTHNIGSGFLTATELVGNRPHVVGSPVAVLAPWRSREIDLRNSPPTLLFTTLAMGRTETVHHRKLTWFWCRALAARMRPLRPRNPQPRRAVPAQPAETPAGTLT